MYTIYGIEFSNKGENRVGEREGGGMGSRSRLAYNKPILRSGVGYSVVRDRFGYDTG